MVTIKVIMIITIMINMITKAKMISPLVRLIDDGNFDVWALLG